MNTFHNLELFFILNFIGIFIELFEISLFNVEVSNCVSFSFPVSWFHIVSHRDEIDLVVSFL